jgi:colanic acid/amylovoran biosynthesis glycosyltransferase
MKIMYILNEFPSPTEYFILNEIVTLEEAGIKIEPFALRRSHITIPEAERLAKSIL